MIEGTISKGMVMFVSFFPDGNIIHIQNVMYVHEIKNNLTSICIIEDQNLKVEFLKSHCVIKYLMYHMKGIALGI